MKDFTNATPQHNRIATLGIAVLASTLLLTGLLAVPISAEATTLPATTIVAPVALGAAATYSVLGGTVTSSGTTSVGGDLGVSTPPLVGFPPGVVNGVEHLGDGPAATAQGAMAAATTDATARPPTGANLAGDQAGVTIGPGVYAAGAAISLAASTTMTLDGQGKPNSVFIFQFGAAYSTGASSTIKLVNDAQAANVFWAVTGAVSVGANASFSGTIMAAGAITLGAGASLDGRALSSAAVTLSSNAITMPAGPPTATVVSPVTGSTYLVGQNVTTSFSCADPTGPGVATCIDAASSTSPGVLDTATIGTYVYTVTATSTDGQTGMASSAYAVVAPDAVAFMSPPTSAQTTTTSDAVVARGTPGDAGAMTYSSNTPSVCAVDPHSGALSFVAFGTCTIGASQAPDPADSFGSGSAVTTIAVTLPDALVFTTPTPTTVVKTTMIDVVVAQGSPGDAGAITYTSQTPSICGVSPASGALNFVTVGTCSVQATQAADPTDGYLSTTVVRNITVNTESTLAFVSAPTTAVTTTTTDAVLAAGAASDHGPISYTSITPATCAVNALTGVLSYVTFGACIVEATQAADATDGYEAGTVETSIGVTAPDILAFVTPPTHAFTTTTTDTVLALGTPGDKGAITYASQTPSVCTVGSTVGTLVYASFGDCVIVAAQAADATDGYAPATAATSVTVSLPAPPPPAFFTQQPGAATDIALGANGSLWVIGTPAVNGGHAIYHWTTSGWAVVAGGAVTIAVGPDGNPWVINSSHQIYRWNGLGWVMYPGAAIDLAVGANGSVWLVGTNPVGGGNGIYSWNGTGWAAVAGGAVTIAVGPDGNPWVINSSHQIFHLVGPGWTTYPGSATDIAVGANGSVWLIGTNAVVNGYGIYSWNGTGWSAVAGGAVTIAVTSGGDPWVINSTQEIYRH